MHTRDCADEPLPPPLPLCHDRCFPSHTCCLAAPGCRLQFSASKWLPGGRAGAAQLAAAVDLGGALTLLHVDLNSLQVAATCFVRLVLMLAP